MEEPLGLLVGGFFYLPALGTVVAQVAKQWSKAEPRMARPAVYCGERPNFILRF